MADSYKNTDAPIGSGERAEPIKISTTGLRAIVDQGSSYVQHLVDASPVQIDSMFGVVSGARADAMRASVSARMANKAPADIAASGVVVDSIYARGTVVMDTELGKKVTIVKTCVGTTKKGYNVHKVVDQKSGNTWLQSEKKLRPL